jgi:hypothetical protein
VSCLSGCRDVRFAHGGDECGGGIDRLHMRELLLLLSVLRLREAHSILGPKHNDMGKGSRATFFVSWICSGSGTIVVAGVMMRATQGDARRSPIAACEAQMCACDLLEPTFFVMWESCGLACRVEMGDNDGSRSPCLWLALSARLEVDKAVLLLGPSAANVRQLGPLGVQIRIGNDPRLSLASPWSPPGLFLASPLSEPSVLISGSSVAVADTIDSREMVSELTL